MLLRAIDAPAGILLAGALLLAGCSDQHGGSLYVTSGLTDEVVRLDARDGTEVRRISVDRRPRATDEPHAVAIAPDGLNWYVTVAHGQPSLWKFETESDRLVGRVDLTSGGAAMIGLSPDGGTAYIPDYDRAGGREGRVAAVRLRDLVVIGNGATCGTAHDAAVHPDGSLVAIACAGSDEIVLLDARTLNVRARHAAPAPTAAHTMPGGHVAPGGARPLSVAWSPDGATLAVALHAASAIWIVDRAGKTIASIPVAGGPAQVAFVDDRTVVTANRMDGSMSVIDLERRAELRHVQLDAQFPHGIAVDGDARIAYVAFEGSPDVRGGVVAVDVDDGRLLWRSEVGRYVLGIALLPD